MRRTYTWIAPVHDLLALLVERKARRLAVEWAAVQNGERVLEVAVGTGLSFRKLLRRNPDGFTDGVDWTPAILRRARRRARRALPSATRRRLRPCLPRRHVRPRLLQLHVCSYMFDLLPKEDFVDVLGEFARVLRPGGRIALAHMTTPRH